MKIKNYLIIKFLVMKFNRYADMQKKKIMIDLKIFG